MENKNDRCRVPPRPTGDAPWLVYTYGFSIKKKTQTFYNISDSTNTTKSIPELRAKIICASYYGWLVLRDLDNPKKFSLWNVLTSDSLILPPLPHLPMIDNTEEEEEVMLSNCSLTSPLLLNTSDTTDCVLVLFFRDHVFWCRPTLNNTSTIYWVTQTLDDIDGKKLLKIRHSTTLNGIIYSWADVRTTAYGAKRKLVTLKVDDNDFNLLTLNSLEMDTPDCEYPYVRCWHYLVESCGLIYCVGVFIRHINDDKISHVKVWELDLLDRNWVEVKSLDGRAFFLEHNSCTWCWGSSDNNKSSSVGGVQGNCVYFIRNYDILCSYNLAEGCLTQFRICTNLQGPIYSVNWLSMMPQQNRLTTIQYSKKTDAHINDEEKVDDDDDDLVGRESLLISKLPKEMIELISEYLNLFDYENFRASCKTLQSIVLPVSEKRTSSNNKLASLLLPKFIFFKDDDGLCEVIDLSRYSHCISSSNHLQLDSNAFRVEFSKDGWLVLYNPYWEAIRYVNLLTKEWTDLLFDDELLISDVKGIGFSTNPESPDCVTILFANLCNNVIYYIRYEDETWSKCEFGNDNEEDKFWAGRSSPVYFAGAFYVLGVDGRLGEFKVAAASAEDGKNHHHWKVYGSPATRDDRFHSYHLVECDDDLLGVFIGYMGMWVEVFKFNLCELKWIKVNEGLGNYSLFVSNPSSCSTRPTEVLMRNRIYVSRLNGNHHILFYSFDTGKFHVSGTTGSEDDSYEDFFGTTEPLHCFWLQENSVN